MKKMLIVFLLFHWMLIFLTAEDADQNSIERFSINWCVGFYGQPEAFSRMSVIGFGFLLFDNHRLDIQNQLEFSNGVIIMEDTGEKYFKKSLVEKISLGMMTRDDLLRPYGFLEGGIGTGGDELYDAFENPLIGNIGLGAGVDIFATKNWSFSLEIGFLGNIYQGEFIPHQGFKLGTMWHF
ncbi:MAG: hypothetical protein PF447_00295 [Spirochaetaceae bacterium]|nr:hypothetical protein [Spirochaetaceae bacterium]